MGKRKHGRAARNARKAALGIPTLFKGKKSKKFVSLYIILSISHIISYLFLFRKRLPRKRRKEKLLKQNKELPMRRSYKKNWLNSLIP